MKYSLARLVAVLMLASSVSGCATYGLTAKYNNGGDVPPILTAPELASGQFTLQPGDTVALVNGRLMTSTATQVNVMSKTTSNKPERPSKFAEKKAAKSEAKNKRKQSASKFGFGKQKSEDRPSKWDFKARKAAKESNDRPSKWNFEARKAAKESNDRPSKFQAKTAIFRKPKERLTKEERKQARDKKKAEKPSKSMMKLGTLSRPKIR